MDKKEMLETFDILRIEYIKLLNDKDVLIHWGKPQLEALFNTRIGVYQIELLNVQIRVQALKRKLEMIRSAIARDVPFNINDIENLIEEELAQAMHELITKTDQLAFGEDLLQNLASPTRSADLRSLYRQMAKQLHPDVVADSDNIELKELWNRVQKAYKEGDVETLRALQIAYSDVLEKSQDSIDDLTESELSLKIESLKEGIKLLNKSIDKIRQEFPFNMEEKIKDEAWVDDEKSKLQSEIKEYRAFEGELILEYQIIIINYGDTTFNKQ
jgi:transcriptional regulator with AAA-type ATPase domain